MRSNAGWLFVALAVAVLPAVQAVAEPRAKDAGPSAPLPAADARNTGVVASLALEARPRVLWTFKPEGQSIGAVTAFDDLVYVVSGRDVLKALRADDGQAVWQRDLVSDYVSGVAISGDPDAGYCLSTSHDRAVALDRKTGAFAWWQLIERGLAGPVIADKRAYAAGFDGTAYAMDLLNGDLLWRHDYLKDAPQDPPGFSGERARAGDRPARPRDASCDGELVCFCVFDQCRVIALDCKTGARRWAFRTEGWMYGRPTLTDKYVFAGSQDKHFYCLDKATGNLAWKFKTGSRIEAACAVSDRDVFIGSCDANLYCLSQDTGEVRWQFATDKRKEFGGPIYSQPIVSQDTVYLPAMEGQVYALNASSGELKWKLRPSADSEIDGSFTDGKRIYITTRKNSEGQGEDALYVLGK